ncbi:hypothetical protein LTR47_001918 [Exophiala xenobiotica]|nr:hypothetical protein LTR47_001918 [Exophiala xenobiotica]KAK5251064.1 hypothetical protein LTS06_004214 [Exophiala xenobiotica]KAK5283663.1 hypothetical protein LTR40_001447 [Exophiala xenobiotica]KAK5356299.1 hypothetical protein LTR61_000034 [Exophiala xenobiotica]KAK5364803.1 hypothetical protein LTS13_008630 [Exophiala xenobiotica]
MDGTDLPSSSKVIVQCTDPDNLYDSLEPRLSGRSPLRNLHWKSPNRPLRSIPSLNISLLREDKSSGSQSNVRRHQIPGLRETPYVKLYLLRCDDKESYKEKARKEVRSWVKSQQSVGDGKSSSKSQEGYDAFEWLIVHVVLANTPAASQPKSSKHISLETADSTDSINSKSKWSGKASATIFDKLRADFDSSKSAIKRVAQVRILDASDKSTPLSLSELEEQWQDLVESIKACILRSFDARVAQYESDIRERDSQRNLPGWNFCTFFVLKEGLAKGFESVGLLEDALAVYDELSLGLDSLVKEEAQRGDHDDNGALLGFSKESKALLRAALESERPPLAHNNLETDFDLARMLSVDREDFPFDVDKKDYQNLILRNEVSALDLRTYLFTREMEILLRQGQVESSKSLGEAKSGADLGLLADLTERAINFINLAARSLRLELYSAWGGQEGLSEEELNTQRAITGNIVSNFEWLAAMQILSKVLPALGLDVEYGTGWRSLDSVELSRIVEKKSNQVHETRNRANRMSLAVEARSPSRERSQGPHHKRISVIPEEATVRQIVFSRPGAERLAVWISRLAITARRAVSNLGAARSWVADMKHAALRFDANRKGSMTNGTTQVGQGAGVSDHESADNHSGSMAGIKSSTLQAAGSSKSMFFGLFAMLSVLAYRIVADTKSHSTAQQVLTDLVALEYAQDNYARAARYLHSILGQLPQSTYRPSDSHLLRIYADCLKHLDKPNDHARCLIACLHCASQGRFGAKSLSIDATARVYLDQLFNTVPTMTATTLPLSTLFMVPCVSKTITHPEGKDGFALTIDMRPLFTMTTPPIGEVKLRLSCQDVEPRFIVLKSPGEVTIHATGTKLSLETTVTSQGWYMPDEVDVSIGNLRLLHHFRSTPHDDASQLDEPSVERSLVGPILVYPRHRAFQVKLIHAPTIHLAETRKLLMHIQPGYNNVSQCRLRLKTGTAGLRLNIHDSKICGPEELPSTLRTAREGDALMMIVDDLRCDTLRSIEIPYTMEVQSEPSVTIRIDVNYQTDQGSFTLYDTASVNVILPVTVNVQDVFRDTYMYSRFSISPSTLVPLRILNCHLGDSEAYSITECRGLEQPEVIFPKQPANWTVRLVPMHNAIPAATHRLTLCVDFQSIDDLILSSLEENFLSELLKTSHQFAARLLVGHLLDRVRISWTEQDLEMAALTQEFEIWNMDDMDWPSVLCAFDHDTRSELECWLQDWHVQPSPVKFSSAKVTPRQVRLHVDIAPHPVLVTACLEIDDIGSRPRTATLGQPILADLVMYLANSKEADVEASFEVTASESWLVGGRRKGNVQLTSKPTRIAVILFPQHAGHALLPTITVRCRKKAKGTGDEDAWADLACDVHNPLQGRSILIAPDLQSTTVEVIGDLPNDGTGRLVSIRRRGGVG